MLSSALLPRVGVGEWVTEKAGCEGWLDDVTVMSEPGVASGIAVWEPDRSRAVSVCGGDVESGNGCGESNKGQENDHLQVHCTCIH